MRKTTKAISLFICMTLLFTTLVACTNDTQSYEPTTSQQSSSNSDTTTSATEDEDGRPLIYNNNGIKIYASKVRFDTYKVESNAAIEVCYKVVNSNDDSCSVRIIGMKVNNQVSTGAADTSFVPPARSTVADGSASTIPVRCSSFGLPVIKTSEDKFKADANMAYSIVGNFEVWVDGLVDSGTFTVTIPANFPENKFRTDEKWVSTK
ncbi:MAG: hypothetical protein LBG97_08930 [Coriobacteriales bacterium]|jgi:hypothetical protein|nr:hypothetical protein [Coriobacteriales bacterium]